MKPIILPSCPNSPIQFDQKQDNGHFQLKLFGSFNFLYNDMFEENIIQYDQNYQNEQGYSEHFQNHLIEVYELIKKINIQKDNRLVEVGCGKGKFLDIVKEYYYNNYDDIMELQNGKVSRGTDQPVYNYLLQIHNVNVVHKLPPPFMLNHLYRFDWFSHNWQLNKDKTPFFIKYGYIWFYSGFPARGERYNLMKQTWDAVKGMYI